MSEADIQRAILDAFEAMGVLAWRANAGRVKVKGGWLYLAPAGTPDILVVVPPLGRLLGLEVKTRTGIERDAQVRWRKVASRHGVAVCVVRTTQEAISAYRDAQGRPGATSCEQEAV